MKLIKSKLPVILLVFSLITLTLSAYSDDEFTTRLEGMGSIDERISFIETYGYSLQDDTLRRKTLDTLASLYYLKGESGNAELLYYELADIREGSVTLWSPFFNYLHMKLNRQAVTEAERELETALASRRHFSREDVFPLLGVRIRILIQKGEAPEAWGILDRYRTLDDHEESPELYFFYYLTARGSENLRGLWAELKKRTDPALTALASAYEKGDLTLPWPEAGTSTRARQTQVTEARETAVTEETQSADNQDSAASAESQRLFQVGAFSDRATAEANRKKWAEQGISSEILPIDSWFKVRIRLSQEKYRKLKDDGVELFPVR